MLESIAIRAMVNASTIELIDTLNWRHLIFQARCQQDFAGHQDGAVRAGD
jgi:hypothetical protein